ncbi:MAG: hypothetical protein K2I23_03955, partial [Clostridia bacterium]|nr:hypothetical protein [Clostridia bacterium]
MDFSKNKNVQKVCIVAIIALVMMLSCIGIIFKTDQKAQAGTADATDIGSLTLPNYENQKKTFDKEVFWKLIDMISGVEGSDRSTLETLGATPRTSADFRASTVRDKPSNSDIVVSIGGHQWIAAYVSRSKSDDPILTLWLAEDSYQDIYGAMPTSALFNPDTEKYPVNMYGVSKIRSVVLNNGGEYLKNTTELFADPGKDKNNMWARYTMDNVSGSLTQFIEGPEAMSWQELQDCTQYTPYDRSSNEGYLTNQEDSLFGIVNHNYTKLEKFDTWKTDKLWIPSVSEIGIIDDPSGMWNITTNLRSVSTGVKTWTRTGTCGGTNGWTYDVHTVHPSGTGIAYDGGVPQSCTVRPAFHLNLQKVVDTLDYAAPTDVETIYNGSKQDMESISKNKAKWYVSSAMNIMYGTSIMKDVGTYTATAKLKQSVIDDEMKFTGEATGVGEDAYTRKFNFIIKQKPLSVSWKTESGGA